MTDDILFRFFNVLHLLALFTAMGAALFLEVSIVSKIRNALTKEGVETIKRGSFLIVIGLALFWVSGLGFLYEYFEHAPEKLMNPKVHMKIFVVFIITMNGLSFHFSLMDEVFQEGTKLLKLPADKLRALGAFAAINTVSWLYAFMLGALPELNFVYTLPQMATFYLVLIFGAVVFSMCACAILSRMGLQRKPVLFGTKPINQ